MGTFLFFTIILTANPRLFLPVLHYTIPKFFVTMIFLLKKWKPSSTFHATPCKFKVLASIVVFLQSLTFLNVSATDAEFKRGDWVRYKHDLGTFGFPLDTCLQICSKSNGQEISVKTNGQNKTFRVPVKALEVHQDPPIMFSANVRTTWSAIKNKKKNGTIILPNNKTYKGGWSECRCILFPETRTMELYSLSGATLKATIAVASAVALDEKFNEKKYHEKFKNKNLSTGLLLTATGPYKQMNGGGIKENGWLFGITETYTAVKAARFAVSDRVRGKISRRSGEVISLDSDGDPLIRFDDKTRKRLYATQVEWITGETPRDKRDEIIEKIKSFVRRRLTAAGTFASRIPSQASVDLERLLEVNWKS